jgi:hypothetical protein
MDIRLHEDEWIIMPNHIHGIVWIISGEVAATGQSPIRRVPEARPGPKPKSPGAFVVGEK